jgi:hypothetical protein
MNERFNQLLKQVEEETNAEYQDESRRKRRLYNEILLPKFAELIIRECVKFCEHESNDDEHDEYDMGMWVKAESIKTAIMEEFGIKE